MMTEPMKGTIPKEAEESAILSSKLSPDLDLLICPICHGKLKQQAEELVCADCARTYPISDGFVNLQVAQGFDDEDHEERWACEENTGSHMIDHYMLPLLENLFSEDRSTLRLLSIGCGVGVDVEALNDAGYPCHGIDVGNRAKTWERRSDPRDYTRAAVQAMPFRTGEFDFAFLNCVLPHVGVVGDTQIVAPDYVEQRNLAIKETIRVVRPGGYILISNPNRLCPLDLFHRKNEQSHMPRVHSTGEPFLQSFQDHYRAFVEEGGCQSAKTLPPDNFWGFSPTSKSSRYAVGRVLQSSIRQYFRALSTPVLAPALKTPLNPWLVVLIQR